MKHLFTFFYDQNIKVRDKIFLSGGESFHANKVLRKQSSDTIAIINGKGILAYGKIIHSEKEKIEILVTKIEKQVHSRESRLVVTMNDFKRIEILIEKASELGVAKIVLTNPISNQKFHRFKQISINACKQSKNSILPEIIHLSFEKLVDSLDPEDTNIIADINGSLIIDQVKSFGYKCNIFVGSESGFSRTESMLIDTIKNKSFISLGKNSLRSETAFIVILGYLLK